jgi:glycosyltransferase involved in cell wall biosynthesis
MLAPALVECRVIPNGVDTSSFFPGNRAEARAALAIPENARVLMFASNGIKANVWKDYRALNEAIRILGCSGGSRELVLLAVGEIAPSERIGSAEIRFIPFQKEPSALAQYYRAADIYVHAARIESFGNVLLEARACGIPVVAMAVGGIPEHVKSLDCEHTVAGVRVFSSSKATGILTKEGSGDALARGVLFLLEHPDIVRELGENALRDIDENFQLSVQARRFLDWYRDIIAARAANISRSATVSVSESGNGRLQ